MTDGCIFCGGRPVSREHLWPDWLRREAGITEAFGHRLEDDVGGIETRDVSFGAVPFSHTVKAVCVACNGGWMSVIEEAAKPVLQELIYGRGGALDQEDQRKLATWAFLKACVFDELHPQHRVVPDEHRKRFFAYRSPPATGAAIWLGTYEARHVSHYAYQGLRMSRFGMPHPDAPTMYIVTITTGALIVQIAGSVVGDLGFDHLDLDELAPELHVVKIWPSPSELVAFAQDYVMDHETFVSYTKFLYNVMGRMTGGAPPAR